MFVLAAGWGRQRRSFDEDRRFGDGSGASFPARRRLETGVASVRNGAVVEGIRRRGCGRVGIPARKPLAVDGVGNAFRWKFDAANPTAAAAWRAFHDHAETAAGAVVNSQKWNPDVMAGSLSAKFRDQDSFMYRDQYGVKSLLLDDDNCDCLSTLSMGSGMCLEGQQTRYGPARVFGVDNLNDPGCDTPTPEKSLSLYFSEN